MAVKKLVSILLLFLLWAFRGPSEPVISWHQDYALRWEDFQGEVDPFRPVGVESVTQVIIELRSSLANNLLSFTVSCYFEKDKSWTANTWSSYLLNHEQLHFDIAEVYARKLRMELSGLNDLSPRNYEQKVRTVYQRVLEEHNAFQDQYDRETQHSKNREKQADWNEKISQMLEETKAFAAPTLTLNLRGH